MPDEWSTEKVLEMLRTNARRGERASAQVFLDKNIPPEDVKTTAEAIVQKAEAEADSPRSSAEVGKIHKSARSFSVKADPDLIAKIAASKDVTAILPSEIKDIHPKPVKRSPA